MSKAKELLSLCSLDERGGENLPAIYPEIELPATNKTLEDLYKTFNKLYFGGSLKLNFPIKFAAAKDWFGLHRATLSGDKIVTNFIKINKILTSDRKKLIDTVIHEMIHEWQKEMVRKTGDRKYLDKPPADRSGLPGHGQHFISQVNYLNNFGFNISLTDDTSSLIIADTFEFLFFVNKDKSSFPVMSPKGGITDQMKTVAIEGVKKIWGDTYWEEVLHIKTSNPSLVLNAFKMNSKGGFKVTTRQQFNSNLFKGVFKDESTQTISSMKLEGPKSVPDGVIKVVPRMIKFMGRDFYTYLSVGLQNTSEYKSVKIPKDYKFGDKVEGVPDGVLEYLYNKWSDISNKELVGSTFFTDFFRAIRSAMIGVTDRRGFENSFFGRRYEREFQDRVNSQEFTKELYKFVKKKILATTKKSIVPAGEVVQKLRSVWGEMLSGTMFTPIVESSIAAILLEEFYEGCEK